MPLRPILFLLFALLAYSQDPAPSSAKATPKGAVSAGKKGADPKTQTQTNTPTSVNLISPVNPDQKGIDSTDANRNEVSTKITAIPRLAVEETKDRADWTIWGLTIVLFFVGIYQVILLRRSTDAATAAADIANKSLVMVQRAFVFIESFETHIVNDKLIVMPKWRNGGSTAALSMTNWANWKTFNDEPPQDFSFPDLDGGGKPVVAGAILQPEFFIGPAASHFAEALTIPLKTLTAVGLKEHRLFIWGWARYVDVFQVPHETRFCNEITAEQVPAPDAGKISQSVGFATHRRNNSAT